jgi:hypothetical protein
MFNYIVFRLKLWRLERKRERSIKTAADKQTDLVVAGAPREEVEKAVAPIFTFDSRRLTCGGNCATAAIDESSYTRTLLIRLTWGVVTLSSREADSRLAFVWAG